MALPTAQQLVSSFKKSGPLTARQITGRSPLGGGGGTSGSRELAEAVVAKGGALSSQEFANVQGRGTGAPTELQEAPTAIPSTAPIDAQVNAPVQDNQQLVDAFNQKGGALTTSEIGAPQDLASIQRQGLANVQGQAPDTQGEASLGIQKALGPAAQEDPISVERLDEFAQTNPFIQQSTQELMEFLSPESTRTQLAESIDRLVADRREVSGLKLELMNVKRVMEGSDQDIRDEITKSGGFATESLVQALTVGRNRTLLQKANFITDQISFMQDAIQTDTLIYGFQKDAAAQEFQQRSFLVNYQQQNQRDIYNANQDIINRNLDTLGADGLLNSLGGDQVMIDRVSRQLFGTSDGLQQAALQTQQDRALAQEDRALDIDIKEATLRGKRLENNIAQDKLDRANQAIANGQLTPDQGKAVKELSAELRQEPSYKEMFEVRAGFNTAQVGFKQNSGFGDIAMVNGYQRMIDPGATVRGEDIKTQGEAVAYIQRVLNVRGRVTRGDRFTEETRGLLNTAVLDQYTQRVSAFNETTKARYENRIETNPLLGGRVGFDDVGDSFDIEVASTAGITPEVEEKAQSMDFDLEGALQVYSLEEITDFLYGR